MGLQELCSDVVTATEGLTGCLLLDMETGLPLAQATRPGGDLPAEQIVEDTHRIFRSGLIGQFAQALSPPRELAGFVEEAHVTTAEAQHFMAGVPGWDDVLLVLVADKEMRVGIGWMCAREACRRFADARQPATGRADGSRLKPVETAPEAGIERTPEARESSASPGPTPSPATDAASEDGTSADAKVAAPDRSETDAGQPEPPLLVPDTQPAPRPTGATEAAGANSSDPSLSAPDGEPAAPAQGSTERSASPTGPPLPDPIEPPRVARGRPPSIRARRSIPMAQLLSEQPAREADPAPAAGNESPHSETGRVGARASLRMRNKRP